MGGKFYESIDAVLYKQHRISYVQIEIWRMNHDFNHNQNYQKPSRGIYGKATPDQAKALHEEGVPALPIPPALDPKRAQKKLN